MGSEWVIGKKVIGNSPPHPCNLAPSHLNAIGFRNGARKSKMSFKSDINVMMAMDLAETALRY